MPKKETFLTRFIRKRQYSYRFAYTMIGAFFGGTFPIGALVLDFIIHNYQISMWDLFIVNPIHYLIATAPIVLGFMAGLAGIREERISLARYELEEFARDLTERTQEMGDIMNHIEEGILTINKDFTINREYSTFIEMIFGKKDLTGKNFLQLVYPTGNLKEKNDLKEYLNILFTNFSTSDDILRDLNPIKNLEQAYSEEVGEVSVKYLHFDFVRIMLEKKLTKIMVIIKDMTETVKKEREHARQTMEYEEELERISAILRMPSQELESFLEKCDVAANKSETFFKKGLVKGTESRVFINEILSDLHSLKGEANLYELRQLANKIHLLEEKIKTVIDIIEAKEENSEEDGSNISQLMDVMVAISNYKISIRSLTETKNKMIQRVREEEVASPASQTYMVKDFLPKIQKLNQDINQIIDTFNSLKNEAGASTRESWLDNLRPFLENRAKELANKGEVRKVFPLDIQNSLSKEQISQLSPIKSSVIHLVQNSLVHGIEPPVERSRMGKLEKGKINLTLQNSGGFYEIWVEDDGRGIDLRRIQNVLKQRSDLPDEEIAKLTLKDAIGIIFKSGFTSLSSANQIAGRGIGMDAVRRQVQEYKGKLMVRNRPGKGLAICISISSEALKRTR